MATFVTVGFGEIVPENFQYYSFVIGFNLIATSVFAMMNGKLSSILHMIQFSANQNNNDVCPFYSLTSTL